MSKENKNTIIELEGGDGGIIFREGGTSEIVLPNHLGEQDEVSQMELLIAGLAMFLRDPKFVEMIKSEFIKNVQKLNEIKNEKGEVVNDGE